MLELKVINLWGAPGSGKSTLAAGLFNLMKARGFSVELVTEVAKDLTYGREWSKLENQLLILGLQDDRLRRLNGQVEYVITDSPLPLGLAYTGAEYVEFLPDAIFGAYDRYENYDVWVSRGDFPYRPEGRNQTEAEISPLEGKLHDLFLTATDDDVEFTLEVRAGERTAYEVLGWIEDGESA